MYSAARVEGHDCRRQRVEEKLVAQGMMPNLVKVAPAAGISWFIFEEVKRLMGMSPRV